MQVAVGRYTNGLMCATCASWLKNPAAHLRFRTLFHSGLRTENDGALLFEFREDMVPTSYIGSIARVCNYFHVSCVGGLVIFVLEGL